MADEIQMRGPQGCAPTISHGGKTISADKRGIFSVPREAIEDLVRHGFKVVEKLGLVEKL